MAVCMYFICYGWALTGPIYTFVYLMNISFSQKTSRTKQPFFGEENKHSSIFCEAFVSDFVQYNSYANRQSLLRLRRHNSIQYMYTLHLYVQSMYISHICIFMYVRNNKGVKFSSYYFLSGIHFTYFPSVQHQDSKKAKSRPMFFIFHELNICGNFLPPA